MRLKILCASITFLLLFSGNTTAGPQHLHLLWSIPEKTHDNMTVMWSTTYTVKAVQVMYGTSTALGMLENGTTIYQTACIASNCTHVYCKRHIATVILTGLEPDTTYYYRCGEPGNWSARKHFTTPPIKGSNQAIRFAAYGDSRNNGAEVKKINNAVKPYDPLFRLHVGDLVGGGTWQAQWNIDFFPNVEALISECPMLPTLGNHEFHASNYYNQFSLPAPKSWYSLNIGNIHLISLDNDILDFEWDAKWYYDPSSPQYKWLKADLEKADADPDIQWKFVFFHAPPFSSKQPYNGSWIRNDWIPLFEKHKVDIVFCGDNHFYERTYSLIQTAIMDRGPNFVKNMGVLYVTVGGEGAPLTTLGTPDPYHAFQRKVFHFAIIDVAGSNLTLKAYLDDGVTMFDTFTVSKTTSTALTPESPSKLNAVVLSSTTAKLTWQDNSFFETGYIVERKNLSSGSFVVLSTVSANTSTFNDTGITQGSTYYYRVYAFNNNGNSGYSSEIRVVAIAAFETDPPSNPTICYAWMNSSKLVEISDGNWQNITTTPYFIWSGATDTVSGIDGYSIYFGTSTDQDPGKVIALKQNFVQISSGTVENGNVYYLRLRTCDNAGNWSEPVTMFVYKYISSLPEAMTKDPISRVNVSEKDIILKVTVNSSTGIVLANLEYSLNNSWDCFNESEMILKETSGNTFTYEAIIRGEDVSPQLDKIGYRVRIRDTIGSEVVASTGVVDIALNVRRVINREGGYISLEDGDLRDGKTKIQIPYSALDQEVTLTLTQLRAVNAPAVISNNWLEKNSIPAAVYDLGPDGQIFNKSISITLLYPEPGNTTDENDYRIFWHDGTDWRYVGGSVNTANNTVTAWVNHFSKYAVFKAVNIATLNAQSYKPKEKILTLNNDGVNDAAFFSGLQTASQQALSRGESQVSVNIYNLKNKLVRTLTDTELWDGTDNDGNKVENGVYIYQYELNGERVTGSIVVAK
ncbi:MAG: fibronectin type III domain-containing protein [Elusimicrobiota bacterium]